MFFNYRGSISEKSFTAQALFSETLLSHCSFLDCRSVPHQITISFNAKHIDLEVILLLCNLKRR